MITREEIQYIKKLCFKGRAYEAFEKWAVPERYFNDTNPFSNTSLRFSSPLIKVLNRYVAWDNKPQVCLYVLQKLLADHHNPNEVESRTNPMMQAFLLAVPNELKRAILRNLFMYGGNPFFGSYPPIQWAKEFGATYLIDLVDRTFTRPQKSIASKSDSAPKIMNVDYFSSSKYILTEFTFTNNAQIYSCIKNTSKLNRVERQALFELFCKVYEDPYGDDCNLQDSFDSAFTSGKIVELITTVDKGKVKYIGFNLFEVIRFDEMPQFVTLHCHYTGLLPSYRCGGYMNYCIVRPAIGLDTILDGLSSSLKTIISVSAMTADGLWLVQSNELLDKESDCKYYPKFQSAPLQQLATLISKHTSNSELQHDDTMKCYIEVKAPLSVRNTSSTARRDILSEFFYNDLQAGYSDNKETPLLCHVNGEFHKKHAKFHTKTGIDFSNEAKRFAPHLKVFLSGMYPTLFSTPQNRKRALSKQHNSSTTCLIRSKL